MGVDYRYEFGLDLGLNSGWLKGGEGRGLGVDVCSWRSVADTGLSRGFRSVLLVYNIGSVSI